ncbi:DUF6933 domain-containing protein [Dactylosporangium fulvum]|uniref:DUF6933 domain-containing protein n=1 Tax=Dactylosporangium fulvum TaxID=53359 RepID=A0ABY5VUW9_9ACTN|nr:hypothetical protein [Dactylosporangium fulvum]UWP81577.1 hypothetical protein Dfulv_41740 [Dactylosporangium fulvum]
MRLDLIRDDGVVLIVRATKKLRDRIGPPDLCGGEQSTTVLGEWYATRFGWRPDVLLLVNESTLLPVLLPLAPAATALSRAVDRIAVAMATHGTSAAIIAAELEQMRTHRIGTTANRGVVGIMSEFSHLADAYRDRGRQPNLDELAARLATTPCSPLYRTHISPDRAFTALVHTIPE